MEKIIEITENKCCVCDLDFEQASIEHKGDFPFNIDKITDNGLVFEFCNNCFKKATDLAVKKGDACKSWKELVNELASLSNKNNTVK